jgi:hypothetical protein
MASPSLQPSGERRLNWVLLVLALAASVLLVRRATPHAGRVTTEVDLIGAVPQGPELLITAELGALSPAVALDLLRAGGGTLLGLRELCGFEPLLALKRVALATPFRAETAAGAGDFALIADTSLEPEAVLRCAEAVIRKRGRTPVRSNLGRFTSVRDQGKPLGEVAIRADGLFVLSGGQYFRDVIDAANGAVLGDEAARLRTQLHRSMRRRLAPSQLVVTLLPGASLPLPGVRALGLGLEVQSDVRLRGYVGCASTPACGDARHLLERVKSDVVRDSGVAGLESLSVEQREVELDVSGRLPREQLGPLLTQLLLP